MAFSLLLIVVLGATALFFATHLSIPEDRSQRVFAPDLVRRGGELAALGYCASCHTAENGKPFAGGRPLATPFGTIYGTNITPDPKPASALVAGGLCRAMREGVDRAGRDLYPVFPYDHFTRLTDEDLSALYAFLMTREPVRHAKAGEPARVSLQCASAARRLENAVPRRERQCRATSKSAEWNRGAYLVEALAHCGACHTPRDLLGAESATQHFAGGDAEDWWAPALNRAFAVAGAVDAKKALFKYLRSWDEGHAVAAGPMAPVVAALATVPEQDVRAIAAYVAVTWLGRAKAKSASTISKRAPLKRIRRAAELYAGACATCHETGGQRAVHRRLARPAHVDIRARSRAISSTSCSKACVRRKGRRRVHAGFRRRADRRADRRASLPTCAPASARGADEWQNVEAEIAQNLGGGQAHDHPQRQRPAAAGRRRPGDAAALRAARRSRSSTAPSSAAASASAAPARCWWTASPCSPA